MTSEINITKLWADATAAEIAEHAKAEEAKLGGYRGGNTGALLQNSDGSWQPAGKCHRLTHLRHLGIKSEKIPDDRHIMFAGGRNSEVVWLEKLERSWPGKILTEEEIPTKWHTVRGVPVTGRPDIVLCSDDGTPQLGLELKMASSKWTSRDVRIMNKPKFDHLTQAAHYSWQLGVPFKLCYIQYVDFGIGMGWEGRLFPDPGEPGSEVMEYRENRRTGEVTPNKIRPWMYVYDLRFTDIGVLQFRAETDPDGTWTSTPISISSIMDYYNYVDDMKHLKFLGPRPSNIDGVGGTTGWKKCDSCPLRPICDSKEDNYDEWMAEVKEKAKEFNDD